jgi:D-glycero-alpha-D-manno-heptose 1-phosphate guanylyltransferase
MLDLTTTSALILAGGLGTRLRSAVADRPKVLAEVRGQPFLLHLLDGLVEAGVRHVVLATGYRADDIEEVLREGYRGLEIEFSREPEPRGTGGAIALALARLRSPRVLVQNGDSFCAADLRAFAKSHASRRASLTLLATAVDDAGRYGRVVVDDDGAVTAFREKDPDAGAGLINAGVYLLERAVLDALPRGETPFSFEREVLGAWIGRGLYATTSDGPFIDIGLPATYAKADRFFAEMHHAP